MPKKQQKSTRPDGGLAAGLRVLPQCVGETHIASDPGPSLTGLVQPDRQSAWGQPILCRAALLVVHTNSASPALF